MQIATASGPCGNNREYLFKLEKAMHDIGEFHNDFALNRKINKRFLTLICLMNRAGPKILEASDDLIKISVI